MLPLVVVMPVECRECTHAIIDISCRHSLMDIFGIQHVLEAQNSDEPHTVGRIVVCVAR